jgi:hypothetical protein
VKIGYNLDAVTDRITQLTFTELLDFGQHIFDSTEADPLKSPTDAALTILAWAEGIQEQKKSQEAKVAK